jgi:hypothetical protein
MTKRKKYMKTITKSIYAAFACFGICAIAEAVTPAPDGNYPNFNTAEGDNALFSLTAGSYNTAIGAKALFHDTTGAFNTANGAYSLSGNTSGSYNTATGELALYINTTGVQNTANGVQALFSNTTGSYNTANGVNAMYSNTTGLYNTGSGSGVLFSNTTGPGNTATGYQALYHNTTGGGNTGNGIQALYSNTTSSGATATGYQALYHNTTGPGNTATGYRSLVTNTTGSGNTAIGSQALQANASGNSNTAIGRLALVNTTGSSNIALGASAGQNLTTGGSNIDIGNAGVAGESNIIRLGSAQNDAFIAGLAHISPSATSIAGIKTTDQGQPAVAVYINTNTGQLGTIPPPSSRRFKEEIRPMDQTSEAILGLKPVSFRYKKEIDPKGKRQFGLVAEDVAKVNPDLVVRDANGKVYTVRYDAVNAMLLNEFLKEHRKMQQQEATIIELKSAVAQQQRQIEAVTVGLQKVSTQVEMNRPATQTIANDQ